MIFTTESVILFGLTGEKSEIWSLDVGLLGGGWGGRCSTQQPAAEYTGVGLDRSAAHSTSEPKTHSSSIHIYMLALFECTLISTAALQITRSHVCQAPNKSA